MKIGRKWGGKNWREDIIGWGIVYNPEVVVVSTKKLEGKLRTFGIK